MQLPRMVLHSAIAVLIAGSFVVDVAAQEPQPTNGGAMITDVEAYDITPTSARITWTVSERATGQVEYGPTTTYGSRSTLEDSFEWATHIQQLSGLEPGTTYHFRTHSTTESGITVASDDHTFTTLSLDAYRSVTVSEAPSDYGPRAAPTMPDHAVVVPGRIDATGATDVGEDLQRWVNRQAAGSTLVFPAGATYRLERGIHLDADDTDLTFYGYGATLATTGCGTDQSQSGFHIDGSQGIRILGFTIVGGNDEAGTFGAYDAGCGEWSMGVAIFGDARDIEVADTTIQRTFGDALYVACWEAQDSGGFHFHHNLLEYSGRQLVTINQGTGIRIHDNVLRAPALFAIDSEDCTDGNATLRDVEITDNWFDTWNWHYRQGRSGPAEDFYPCQAISMDYVDGDMAEISRFTVRGNHLTGGCGGWGSSLGGLCQETAGTVNLGLSMPMTDVLVVDNTFDLPDEQRCGLAVKLENVTSGAISGNLAPGQSLVCRECTDVEVAPAQD